MAVERHVACRVTSGHVLLNKSPYFSSGLDAPSYHRVMSGSKIEAIKRGGIAASRNDGKRKQGITCRSPRDPRFLKSAVLLPVALCFTPYYSLTLRIHLFKLHPDPNNFLISPLLGLATSFVYYPADQRSLLLRLHETNHQKSSLHFL